MKQDVIVMANAIADFHKWTQRVRTILEGHKPFVKLFELYKEWSFELERVDTGEAIVRVALREWEESEPRVFWLQIPAFYILNNQVEDARDHIRRITEKGVEVDPLWGWDIEDDSGSAANYCKEERIRCGMPPFLPAMRLPIYEDTGHWSDAT